MKDPKQMILEDMKSRKEANEFFHFAMDNPKHKELIGGAVDHIDQEQKKKNRRFTVKNLKNKQDDINKQTTNMKTKKRDHVK